MKNAKVINMYRGQTKNEGKQFAKLLVIEDQVERKVLHTIFLNYSDYTKELWNIDCDNYNVPVNETLGEVEIRQYVNKDGRTVYSPTFKI